MPGCSSKGASSSTDAQVTTTSAARHFIPYLERDTVALVSKINEAKDEAEKAQLRKDVVSIEEDDLINTTVSTARLKSQNGVKSKRKHAKPLFKSKNGSKSKEGSIGEDGLVPLVSF